MTDTLLTVTGLSVHFPIKGGGLLRRQIGEYVAVDDVSFSVPRGTTLGIVGESGSGKSSTVRAILRAIDPHSGSAIFESSGGPVDLCDLSERELLPIRPDLQMVFQDPFASLNPRMKVGDIVEEPLIIHRPEGRGEHRARVVRMLERVGLGADALHRFPHAFSGGQRQRVAIARALILEPRLVVCDEAISALDVSVQAQLLNLLRDLQDEMSLTYLFVAHDLNVVHHFCDEALVMYQGRIVESGKVEALFEHPAHDYTRLLLSAIPSTDPDVELQPLDRASLDL